MLKIRLQRTGRKNDPSFRAVCVDSRKGPKAGKHTELLGSYDPKQNRIAIKGERVKYWISNGAQVSDTMHNLLVKEGIIKGKKIHVAKEKKKEEAKAEVKTDLSAEASAEAEAPKEVSNEVKLRQKP
jgi:small subunit ribosomal protein S16